ncbi:MAG: ABC transporter ATP-binding protein [Acidobacteriota bacterium]
MGFLHLEEVGKDYQPNGPASVTTVLNNINLIITESEFVAVMGPSGSGKSTLLSVLGAMNRPSQGRVIIDDIDIYSLPEERQADFRREYIGFVFQQHHLLGFLTALENVALPLAVARISQQEKRQRALEALRRVGLVEKSGRLPAQLSGGEQGRVAVARALVNEPPLLLADEPTGNLDSHTGDEVMALFTNLNRQGQTIIMVTHNGDNARLAHRIIRMRDGEIEPESSSGVTQVTSVGDMNHRC